jgi:hypothetical protein
MARPRRDVPFSLEAEIEDYIRDRGAAPQEKPEFEKLRARLRALVEKLDAAISDCEG